MSPLTIDESKRPAASVPPPASAAYPMAPSRVATWPPPTSSLDLPPVPSAPHLVLAESESELPPTNDDGTNDDVPLTTRQATEIAPEAAVASAAAPALGLTLDFDALERAAQDAVSPSLFHSADLPPPPKNLFPAREKDTGSGAYRAAVARADGPDDAGDAPSGRLDPREEPGTREDAPDDAAARRTSAARIPAARPADPRYAPARPAAIFGSAQKAPPAASIFSDELVSDKSLDEVILSYLAEDLEPPKRK